MRLGNLVCSYADRATRLRGARKSGTTTHLRAAGVSNGSAQAGVNNSHSCSCPASGNPATNVSIKCRIPPTAFRLVESPGEMLSIPMRTARLKLRPHGRKQIRYRTDLGRPHKRRRDNHPRRARSEMPDEEELHEGLTPSTPMPAPFSTGSPASM